MIERTLAILKPDSVGAGRSGAILARLEEEGFRLRGVKRLRLSEDQARAFYAVHSERPFFDGLVRFMTEGPIVPVA
ncbi:MAG: nucleoside-diphosphate kinase, partial [Acidobacteriota bacterium]|nr:nucleoside-diphosphate kinase [Acidobacteriota bacterium]